MIAAGVAIAILRFFGGSPPGQNMEAAVGATVFGAVIATPGVLALSSQRPAYWRCYPFGSARRSSVTPWQQRSGRSTRQGSSTREC